MRILAEAPRFVAVFFPLLLLSLAGAAAVEPGIDIAAPRVAITQVSNAFAFQPPNLVVEQGDYVRWKYVMGSTLSHTTTSGSACTGNGLWNANLTPTSLMFTRQFLESPQDLPFFCTPHCGFGMTGKVTVTTNIVLQAVDNAGELDLSWTGGGAFYSVNRSDSPGFVSAGTVVLVPNGGDAGTTFAETLQPPVGGVLYYLISNKF